MNYPAEMLIEWKAQREGDLADELDQLDLVTEEKLQGWMADAVEDTMDKILGAIDSISSVSKETLSVLRGLVDETLKLPYLDPEDIAALKYCAGVFEVLPSYMPDLYESARRLSGVAAYVDVLYSAAHRLGNLAGTVDILSSTVDVLSHTSRSLGGLSDTADLLSYSSRKLSGLAEHTPQLLEVARMMSGHSISGYQDGTREIKDAADSIKNSVFSLNRIAATVSDADAYADSPVVIKSPARRWSWNTFWWGFSACAIFVITVLALWVHAHK
jgi:hypothetical protein